MTNWYDVITVYNYILVSVARGGGKYVVIFKVDVGEAV